MSRTRKSPQEKKALEYSKDHFTPGWNSSRMFPRTWKTKKKWTNREYRHKSEALLAQSKIGVTADDVELLADDLTSARFQNSVSRKRLKKMGTVTLKEKVKQNLEQRTLAEGRKDRRRHQYDQEAARAIRLLTELDGEELEAAVLQANLVCTNPNKGLRQILPAKNARDLAIYFLYLAATGSTFQSDALKRNPSLDLALGTMVDEGQPDPGTFQKKERNQGQAEETAI
jgi:hypothetical protein